ncbi:Retrovirus-related Pol polyprotein type-1 like protein [Argiope bruennichi]|uniref:Retrovirus-related Pol polyprotein type-1 like protein n=1 Tax=Argiope bruennichi TaxID=94029 RepID=A0A8T0G404_ARGBR|nr:Retrovirus-related Pol polyprotein type-1 like protein [Argiope bruennichi]
MKRKQFFESTSGRVYFLKIPFLCSWVGFFGEDRNSMKGSLSGICVKPTTSLSQSQPTGASSASCRSTETRVGLNNHTFTHWRDNAAQGAPKINIKKTRPRRRNRRRRSQGSRVTEDLNITDQAATLAPESLPNAAPLTPPAAEEDQSLFAHILRELNSLEPDNTTEANFQSFCTLVEQVVKEVKNHLFENAANNRDPPPRNFLDAQDSAAIQLQKESTLGRQAYHCQRWGEERFKDARNKRKEVCVAWLDVTNAFGAIPHFTIQNALQAAKVGDVFSDLICEHYPECSTRIMSNDSCTERFPILNRVDENAAQWTPLFNLAIYPAIRRQHHHRVLAFADDIVLIEDTPPLLQAKHVELFQELSRIQLELNPEDEGEPLRGLTLRKSVVLRLSGRTPAGTRDTSFPIGGVPLVSLQDFDSHRFLGKPVDFNVLPEFASLNEVAKIGTKLVESALAPWQRLDALKSFFFPFTQFAMRTAQFKKTNWEVVDKALKPGIKNILNLSHFITEGAFTRFADWRFIHKARLNLVLLNGCQQWKAARDQECRCCDNPQETLSHALNRCWGSKSRAYQLRHNCLVERVKKAAERDFTIISENEQVAGTRLRPDIILEDNRKILVVDITVPFENKREAFDKARQMKIEKYASLVDILKKPGKTVEILPFVIGSLDSWDPNND